MALFQIEMEVGAPNGGPAEKLTATVGTKAQYAWAPQRVLEQLGVQVEKRVPMRHPGDGRLIKRDIGQATVQIGDRVAVCPVVFGAERDAPLLGSETLEALGLQVDTVKQQLRPAAGATA
jgi:predicted aspartyl protease